MRFFIRLPRVDKRRPSRRATPLPAGTRVGDDAVAAGGMLALQSTILPATLTVLAMGQPSPTTIVSDGVNVFWVNDSPNGGVTRSVMKVPVGRGMAVPVPTNLRQPMHLAVDAAHAYWTDAASTFPNATILMSAPLDGSAALDGGAPTVLVGSNIELQQGARGLSRDVAADLGSDRRLRARQPAGSL
jgi:hypothetical protein